MASTGICAQGGRLRLPLVARQPAGRGRIRDMVPIQQRPPHVEDRSVGGHWEGDLVVGRRPSAVATLVERRTRYLRLVALPHGIKVVPVREALVADLNQVPFWQRRSLTWDRGRELADHARLTEQTGCRVYFCDPRSPWQRGTNENTNRLLRQYLPKTGNLNSYDQAALDAIADRLSSRPRAVAGLAHPSRSDRLPQLERLNCCVANWPARWGRTCPISLSARSTTQYWCTWARHRDGDEPGQLATSCTNASGSASRPSIGKALAVRPWRAGRVRRCGLAHSRVVTIRQLVARTRSRRTWRRRCWGRDRPRPWVP